MGAGGFQVTLTELAETATVFDKQSDTFEAIMPNGGPAVPDGGGGDIDEAMSAAVKLLGALHQQMAAVIANHGAKLSTAHDNYETTEENNIQLIHNIGIQGQV